MSASSEITKTLSVYFDGIHFSDVSKLRQVFHPQAIYACATDGTLLYKNMPDYFEIVANRASPASKGEARTDEIISMDVVGETMALAKVKCSIAPKHFTDFLNLVKLDGQWRIISKVFHYDLAE